MERKAVVLNVVLNCFDVRTLMANSFSGCSWLAWDVLFDPKV
jgi:hypothetical protein